MPNPRCPSCQREVEFDLKDPRFPFCSERCRAVDLGKWLNEEYRIVVSSADEDEDGDFSQLPRQGRPPEDA